MKRIHSPVKNGVDEADRFFRDVSAFDRDRYDMWFTHTHYTLQLMRILDDIRSLKKQPDTRVDRIRGKEVFI